MKTEEEQKAEELIKRYYHVTLDFKNAIIISVLTVDEILIGIPKKDRDSDARWSFYSEVRRILEDKL